MNTIGLLFTLVAGILLLQLPRHWAFLPLMLAATLMTRGQELDLGLMHFPVVRILITIGFVRVIARGERITGGINSVDRVLVAWAVWLVCSGVVHETAGFVPRVGIVWDHLGCYFLFRIFIKEVEDIDRIFKALCLLLLPVAAAMLVEKVTGKNCFASLGGVNSVASLRHGHFRAQGPFVHAILAGTVGAVCFPMALLLWRQHRKLALVGLVATGGIVYASGSSGPAMTVFSIIGAMALWRIRTRLHALRWITVFVIIVLDIVMNDPVYFLMARVDITGGSTGWHRAALIQSAIQHLDEWWLVGTDYTRHWMPTGIPANEIHTDITNHYLQMGVWGGLPLMVLFIWVLCTAFAAVGKALDQSKYAPMERQFLIWTLGSILFGHATNFFSISYFDQSVVFLYLLLAIIGSLRAMSQIPSPDSKGNAARASVPYESNLCHHC